jgi:hypothetical protein
MGMVCLAFSDWLQLYSNCRSEWAFDEQLINMAPFQTPPARVPEVANSRSGI